MKALTYILPPQMTFFFKSLKCEHQSLRNKISTFIKIRRKSWLLANSWGDLAFKYIYDIWKNEFASFHF